MNVYSHVGLNEQADAIGQLPGPPIAVPVTGSNPESAAPAAGQPNSVVPMLVPDPDFGRPGVSVAGTETPPAQKKSLAVTTVTARLLTLHVNQFRGLTEVAMEGLEPPTRGL